MIPHRRGFRGRASAVAAVIAAVGVGSCETPSLPLEADPYDFRLRVPDRGPLTFHWSLGTEVPVYVPGPEPPERPTLSGALETAAERWNEAAILGEVRARETSDLGEALAVLRWRDTEPVLTTPLGCVGPVIGVASTRGCLNDTGDGLVTWVRRDQGPSSIILVVEVGVVPGMTAEFLDGVVTHELGHVLGVLDHSDDAEDIMWGGVLASPELTQADRVTLRVLYQTPVDLTY